MVPPAGASPGARELAAPARGAGAAGPSLAAVPPPELHAFGGAVERPEEVLAAAARLAGLPEPSVPRLAPFGIPPARELLVASSRVGRRLSAAVRLYPTAAVLSRLTETGRRSLLALQDPYASARVRRIIDAVKALLLALATPYAILAILLIYEESSPDRTPPIEGVVTSVETHWSGDRCMGPEFAAYRVVPAGAKEERDIVIAPADVCENPYNGVGLPRMTRGDLVRIQLTKWNSPTRSDDIAQRNYYIVKPSQIAIRGHVQLPPPEGPRWLNVKTGPRHLRLRDLPPLARAANAELKRRFPN